MIAEKRLLPFFLALFLTLSISGCAEQSVSESSAGKAESTEASVAHESDHKREEANVNVFAADGNEAAHETIQADKQEETESMLQMRIGDTLVAVEWEDNKSVQALSTADLSRLAPSGQAFQEMTNRPPRERETSFCTLGIRLSSFTAPTPGHTQGWGISPIRMRQGWRRCLETVM